MITDLPAFFSDRAAGPVALSLGVVIDCRAVTWRGFEIEVLWSWRAWLSQVTREYRASGTGFKRTDTTCRARIRRTGQPTPQTTALDPDPPFPCRLAIRPDRTERPGGPHRARYPLVRRHHVRPERECVALPGHCHRLAPCGRLGGGSSADRSGPMPSPPLRGYVVLAVAPGCPQGAQQNEAA